MSKRVVRAVWSGSPLSVYEQLSLASFVYQGHAVELFSYDEIEVPHGVQLSDARRILPYSSRFSYSTPPAKGSFAAFSNVFRFKMLYELGGIWADLDTLCLKKIDDLPEAFVSWEPNDIVNVSVCGFSPRHAIARSACEELERVGNRLLIGDTAKILTSIVKNNSKICSALPYKMFYPIGWEMAWVAFDPETRHECEKSVADSYCLHWWNTAVEFGMRLPKAKLPPPGSYLFEKAAEVFGSRELPAWSPDEMSPFLKNLKDLQKS